MKILDFNYEMLERAVDSIYERLKNPKTIDLIVAIGRGGFVPSVYISHRLSLKKMSACFIDTYDSSNKREKLELKDLDLTKMPKINGAKNILVVDDIVDSGQTLKVLDQWFKLMYPETTVQYACLVYKPTSVFSDVIYGLEVCDDSWVKFPWEV